jgi:hypothetical protein
MTYTKPQLRAYSAIGTIQSVQTKMTNSNEPDSRPTQPAYEADE